MALPAEGAAAKAIAGLLQVARNVTAETLDACGHFVPEERPEAVIRHVRALAAQLT